MAQRGEEKQAMARVCRWYGGKQAAISLRFDDAHPTHIECAAPMLNEFGFVGTFLVNPGNPNYQERRAAWEEVVRQGHELGDHTFRHRGARTDQEAEEEIGAAAEAIREIQESPYLLSFLGGGATLWLQRKPIAFFRAKYDLFSPPAAAVRVNQMSCSEQYPWFSVAAFVDMLERTIAEGGWMQPHFHPVGEGHLWISPAVFRQLLEEIRAREDRLWQAGISAIYQYDQARAASHVWSWAVDDNTLALDLACATDPQFFQHRLTLEVDLPPRVRRVEVTDASDRPLASRVERAGRGRVVRFEAPPVDARFIVRATGLGAAHRAAHGPDLAAPGPPPYLFFSRADAAALVAKGKQAPVSMMWDRIYGQAESLIEGDPSSWRAGGSSWDTMGRLRVLGLCYALTGKASYADRAKLELRSLLDDREWRMPEAEALRTAEAIAALALAYDWIHDALTEDERARVRQAIIQDGIAPILEATDKEEWWTAWFRCNWGSVIYGQAGVAALALLGDEPRAADWARLFRRKIWHYTWALGPDGGWGESGSYATYAWFRALLLADALDHVTGGRDSLFENPNLPHLWEWFTQILEPDEVSFVPFSNCGQGAAEAAPILYRLARAYREGHAEWFARRMTERRRGADVFSFLWCDPELAPVPPDDLPIAKVFSSVDWGLLRGRWADPQATLFGLKGGQKDWDHQHHDTNHFVLYAYGRPLIVDLLYPHQLISCQTEAHNTIMVNEKEQRGTVRVAGGRDNPRHRGIIAGLIEAPWYARLVGDASLAYDQEDVRSAVREVMYLRQTDATAPPDYLVMLDDVEATRPVPMDWLLHSYGDIAVDGSRITIVQDRAAVDIIMVAPESFRAELKERSLEEAGSRPPFEGATAIRWVKLRPTDTTARGFFLSVLAPRLSESGPAVSVSPLRQPNLLGAVVESATSRDLALFALDQPEIAAAGVEALARSCLVRTSGGQVRAAAVHGGQWLTVEGQRIYHANSSGDAVVTFGDDVVEARLSLYDVNTVQLYAPTPPVRVLVDGRETEFRYDPALRCAEVTKYAMRRVQVVLR